MSDKIQEVNATSKNIVVNNLTTLDSINWKEIKSTNGRDNIKVFSSNRQEWQVKRQKEFSKGYLTEEEYSWMVDKFFQTLPSWHSLYAMQVDKYSLTTHSTYLTYQTAYNKLQELHNTLKSIKKDSQGKYDISTITDYQSIWQNYYNACDDLDNAILSKIKETSIVKAETGYALNGSNDVPPDWREAKDDANWGDYPKEKKKTQALWARVKYTLLDGSTIRNTPYLISKVGEESKQETISGLSIYLSSEYATWTARGLKIAKTITLTCNYEDIAQVKYEIASGSGITIKDGSQLNIKVLDTPLFASGMTEQVVIRAYVKKDNVIIADATTTLKKQIIGTASYVYLGCLNYVPTEYSHDGIADTLINGDFFLCKSSTISGFTFGGVYELIDKDQPSLATSWQICTTTEKIAQTINDQIALGITQENGNFNNLLVNKTSTLNGTTTINGNITINAISGGSGSLKVNTDAYFLNVYPNKTETYNLGSSSNKWNNAYVKNLNVNYFTSNILPSGTLNLGSSSNVWANAYISNILNPKGNTYIKQIINNASTTMYRYTNTSGTSTTATTTNIYWYGVKFYDGDNNAYAYLIGNGPIGAGTTLTDNSFRVYIPSTANFNKNIPFQAIPILAVRDATCGGTMDRLGTMSLIFDGTSTFQSNSYFSINGDSIVTSSNYYSIKFIVLGKCTS